MHRAALVADATTVVAPVAPTRGELAFTRGVAAMAFAAVRRTEPLDERYFKWNYPYRTNHPAFASSYDWHASVFNHWALLRALRTDPQLPRRAEVIATLEEHFTRANFAIEAEHVSGLAHLEAPYGHCWALTLIAELHQSPVAECRAWRENIAPLERVLVKQVADYFDDCVRRPFSQDVNVHDNGRFTLALAIDYADAVGNVALAEKLRDDARTLCPAPGDRRPSDRHSARRRPDSWASDRATSYGFIAPYLAYSSVVRRTLPPEAFTAWLGDELRRYPSDWATPTPPHPKDQYANHRVGLLFYKAATFRDLASAVTDPSLATKLRNAATAHSRTATRLLEETMKLGDAKGYTDTLDPAVVQSEVFWSDYYTSAHWLAAYATLDVRSRQAG